MSLFWALSHHNNVNHKKLVTNVKKLCLHKSRVLWSTKYCLELYTSPKLTWKAEVYDRCQTLSVCLYKFHNQLKRLNGLQFTTTQILYHNFWRVYISLYIFFYRRGPTIRYFYTQLFNPYTFSKISIVNTKV